MKERPIIFNGEMVRAILAGRKTQTRRVIKPQPDKDVLQVGYSFFTGEGEIEWRYAGGKFQIVKCRCPYGKSGDQLWVREAWAAFQDGGFYDGIKPSELLDHWFNSANLKYRATEDYPDGGYYKWRPSIHMPRWASRIQLEIIKSWPEKLQDITVENAIAEGIERINNHAHWAWKDYSGNNQVLSPIFSFESLWDSINAKRGFPVEDNPWVWAVEFRVIKPEMEETS